MKNCTQVIKTSKDALDLLALLGLLGFIVLLALLALLTLFPSLYWLAFNDLHLALLVLLVSMSSMVSKVSLVLHDLLEIAITSITDPLTDSLTTWFENENQKGTHCVGWWFPAIWTSIRTNWSLRRQKQQVEELPDLLNAQSLCLFFLELMLLETG